MSPYLIPEQLVRNSPQPLYNQIYEQLKRELVLGGHQEGKRFYSYRKLSEIYKTDLRTIAAAVELLIDEGLLKKKGKQRDLCSQAGKIFRRRKCLVCSPDQPELPSFLFQCAGWFDQ